MTGFLLWCSFLFAGLAVTAAAMGGWDGWGWAVGFAAAAVACFEPFRRQA